MFPNVSECLVLCVLTSFICPQFLQQNGCNDENNLQGVNIWNGVFGDFPKDSFDIVNCHCTKGMVSGLVAGWSCDGSLSLKKNNQNNPILAAQPGRNSLRSLYSPMKLDLQTYKAKFEAPLTISWNRLCGIRSKANAERWIITWQSPYVMLQLITLYLRRIKQSIMLVLWTSENSTGPQACFPYFQTHITGSSSFAKRVILSVQEKTKHFLVLYIWKKSDISAKEHRVFYSCFFPCNDCSVAVPVTAVSQNVDACFHWSCLLTWPGRTRAISCCKSNTNRCGPWFIANNTHHLSLSSIAHPPLWWV